jgi:hypothetical protein
VIFGCERLAIGDGGQRTLNCQGTLRYAQAMYVTYVDEGTHYSRWGGVRYWFGKEKRPFLEETSEFFFETGDNMEPTWREVTRRSRML